MDRMLWSLPGPARLLDEIEADFRDGVSVVVAVPEGGPEDLTSAVRSRVREDGLFRWLPVASDLALETMPSRIVLDRAAGAHPSEIQGVGARAVATAGSLCETIVAIGPPAVEAWSPWRSFLNNYEAAARDVDPCKRPVFFTVLHGSMPLPRGDAGLRTLRWEGRMSQLDMQLFVALSQPEAGRDIATRLRSSLIVSLAGSDPRLAAELACCDLAGLLHPEAVLRRHARSRDWQPDGAEAAWCNGSLDKIDGSSVIHSAWLACMGRELALKRRIWEAQIAILFPWVEEQRLNWIGRLKGRLRLPMKTRFGEVIDDAASLELGEILHLVRTARPPLPYRQLKALERHTGLRHELAHIRPVGWERLRAIPEFVARG